LQNNEEEILNYQETIEYLYALLPVYQRQGVTAIKKDLSNIIKLCNHLGNPQKEYQTLHIGGTNGKGTVSHMLSSILQEEGFKVGLYTSPHYIDFRERIKINADYISEDYVVGFVKEMKQQIEEISPSFFELTVAMAFDYFKSNNVDYAIIEVGLGGRLDSTNIIKPIISVITNIGLDHQNMLGETIEEIAYEKAGIIKQETPVVIGEHDEKSAIIFNNRSKSLGSSLTFASQNWHIENQNNDLLFKREQDEVYKIKELPATPFYKKNIVCVLEVCTRLDLSLSQNAVEKGIYCFKVKTNYLGRWQFIGENPDILADSGHNAHAIKNTIAHLQNQDYNKIHYVLGFVKDKDISKILSLFPKDGKYYFSVPQIFRGANVESYENHLVNLGLAYKTYLSIDSALKAAKRTAQANDLIFVGGSSFVVGEVLAKIEKPRML